MDARDFLNKCMAVGVELYRGRGKIFFGGSRAGIDAVIDGLQAHGDQVADLLPAPRCRRCAHLRMLAGRDGLRWTCAADFFGPRPLRDLDRLEPTEQCDRAAGFECSQVERTGILFEVPARQT